jgi:tRNA dimethylallyltransferase
MRHSIYVVQGPTASGKTKLAIRLAQHLQTEVISFDSRQFYEELAIGVARPNQEELSAVKHHFIASQSIESPINAFSYAQLAKPILDNLLQNKGAVVLVGGSAMFADALLLGLDALPHDQNVNIKWQEFYHSNGIAALQEKLLVKDPLFYNVVDINNPVRLIRALEVNELTNKSNTELRQGFKDDHDKIYRVFMDWPREMLYQRINLRVDQMMSEGLEDEAQRFYPNFIENKALQTVGYQELFAFFSAEISRELAIDKIKQHTRNYAKRQLTWLKKYPRITALDPLDKNAVKDWIQKING